MNKEELDELLRDIKDPLDKIENEINAHKKIIYEQLEIIQKLEITKKEWSIFYCETYNFYKCKEQKNKKMNTTLGGKINEKRCK